MVPCAILVAMTFISDHTRLDARSLALHRRVAAKLADTPALLDIARDNLRRWQAEGSSSSLALAEWQSILEKPLEDIIGVLTDPSEDATRLRQSSPFAGVLTEAERLFIYESYTTRGTARP